LLENYLEIRSKIKNDGDSFNVKDCSQNLVSSTVGCVDSNGFVLNSDVIVDFKETDECLSSIYDSIVVYYRLLYFFIFKNQLKYYQT
jgi:hypothetical protein